MSDLNFQSFSNDFGVNSTNEQSGFHGGNLGDRDRNNLVDDNVSTSGAGRNFFSMTYYQQFFDVDTEQVVKRVLNSVIPTNNNFILDFVQPLPDLWGPFWISVTLVFSIGIFGNIAQYIGNTGKGDYGSDFRLVTSASTLIFLYVVFVPMLLFAILWHRKSDLQYPYLDIVCAYGYSLTIFIPVSLLWILNVNWFRWALILTSVTLSGSVLAKAIYPAFKNDSNRLVAFGSVAAVFFLHFLLAFAFKEMFFDAVHPLQTTGAIATPGASQTIGSNITTVLSNVSSSSSPSTIVTPSLPAAAMTSTAAGSTETTDINSPAATSTAVSTASTTTGHPVNNTEANTPKTATKVAESRTTTSATASATNTTTSPPKSSSKSP